MFGTVHKAGTLPKVSSSALSFFDPVSSQVSTPRPVGTRTNAGDQCCSDASGADFGSTFKFQPGGSQAAFEPTCLCQHDLIAISELLSPFKR